jgi:hypothetical protein
MRYCICSPYCSYTFILNILDTHIEASVLSFRNQDVTKSLRALIQIVIINSWAQHQQSRTCTRDNHIGMLFKVLNPLSVWPIRFMYKWSCSETISDTSQHWYLAGHTDSWMYIKIMSAKPRYNHIVIPLPHDTSQAQGEINATLVIAWPFTWSDSLDSFHD